MASITKRGKSYCVVYTYVNEFGETKQKWESFKTNKEAKKRKQTVEYEQMTGAFVAPREQTVEEFMDDFVRLYGEQRWSLGMYTSTVATIRNYVNPIIGKKPIQSITTRDVDNYIATLRKTKPVSTPVHPARSEFLTNSYIQKIIKMMRCAFHQAIRWDLVAKNPFENAILPKYRKATRDIWDAETIRKALDSCTDSRLYLAMNLSFACSLRLGEILGLTWNNVHITDEDIAADNAWIYIDKELQRADYSVMQTLSNKDVFQVFPCVMEGAATRLVLKAPKTESSVRRIWLPKTLAYILRKWQEAQQEVKDFLGDEYQDFDLVVAHKNGRPVDNRIIEKEFERLKKAAELPNVVFHSLRHSSTTYKLKLNHGDIKATQGDTGHSEIEMITKVYAHILDEDRKLNAQKFDSEFYSNPDLRKVSVPSAQPVSAEQLLAQLKESPDLLNSLAKLLAGSITS